MVFCAAMSGRRASRRPGGRNRRRWIGGLLLAGAAVGGPVLAHELIRRRVRSPQAPRWGRSHQFAGRTGAMAFQELGEGPPIVLLHAFGPGYDAAQWRAAAEVLAGRHRVLVPDLPGWGRSPATAAGTPAARGQRAAAELYLGAIEDFLARVVRVPAVVAAAGLPAAYAVGVAARRPDLIAALALVAPLGLGDENGGGLARSPRAVPARRLLQGGMLRWPLLRVTALDLLTSRAALNRYLRHEVYAAPERVDAALLEHHYRVSHLPATRHALAAYLRGDLRYDVTPELAALHQPVWLVWGEAATLPALHRADLWLRLLPSARLDVFAGCGCLPHAEAPASFARGLERFLAGVAAG